MKDVGLDEEDTFGELLIFGRGEEKVGIFVSCFLLVVDLVEELLIELVLLLDELDSLSRMSDSVIDSFFSGTVLLPFANKFI